MPSYSSKLNRTGTVSLLIFALASASVGVGCATPVAPGGPTRVGKAERAEGASQGASEDWFTHVRFRSDADDHWSLQTLALAAGVLRELPIDDLSGLAIVESERDGRVTFVLESAGPTLESQLDLFRMGEALGLDSEERVVPLWALDMTTAVGNVAYVPSSATADQLGLMVLTLGEPTRAEHLFHAFVHHLDFVESGPTAHALMKPGSSATTDQKWAYRAIVEGSARFATAVFATTQFSKTTDGRVSGVAPSYSALKDLASTVVRSAPRYHEEFRRFASSRSRPTPAMSWIPRYVTEVRGETFIATVFSSCVHTFSTASAGCGSWDGVDQLLRDPPATMEAVMHPEKFWRGDGPERPDPVAVDIEGSIFVDTLGELGFGMYFGQNEAAGYNVRASEGWNGDQIRLFRDEGHDSIVWFSTWDTVQDAQEAEAAAIAVSPRDERGRTSAVRRRGRTLLIVRHATDARLVQAQSAFDTWSSAFQ